MKTLLIILALTSLASCGKKSSYDGRKNNPTPPTNSPVDVATELSLKLTETMEATVNYSTDTATQTKYRSGGLESSLSVRNESFKIPQELLVVQGWASHSTTAKLTLVTTGVTIICTYVSQSIGQQTAAVSSMEPEYATKGLKYAFSNCTNDKIDPSVLVDDFDSVVLKVNSASNLETTTRVEAEIKVYE